MVENLVEECAANTEAVDIFQSTPIINDARKGKLEVVKYLREKCHADISKKCYFGYTALNCSSCNGYLDIFKYLVECGVNIEIVDI